MHVKTQGNGLFSHSFLFPMVYRRYLLIIFFLGFKIENVNDCSLQVYFLFVFSICEVASSKMLVNFFFPYLHLLCYGYRKSSVSSWMTELRIFKLLVKYVNDPFAAAQFVNILLPIFKKKALNSGEDAPIMRLRSRTALNLYSSQYLNSFYLPRLLLQK